MASLPYVTSPGTIDKALAAIKTAAVPDKVSQDFVKTMLKISGGSGDQMTSFLKKIGFVNQDGTPNDLYKKFRNPASSGTALAAAIRIAYAPLYLRNEYMHELDDAKLLGLVVEETGQPHDSNPVKWISSCIKHLKILADFKAKAEVAHVPPKAKESESTEKERHNESTSNRNFGLNLGYTINLNLPATADPEVFDAIFKSLKEHLLRNSDA